MIWCAAGRHPAPTGIGTSRRLRIAPLPTGLLAAIVLANAAGTAFSWVMIRGGCRAGARLHDDAIQPLQDLKARPTRHGRP